MWWIILIVAVIIIFGILGGNHESKKKKNRADKLSTRLDSIENFKVSKKIDGFGGFYSFAIDNDSEKFAFLTEYETKIFEFKDVIGVEIIEDGSTISKKSATRTIGGAIVGGVLAGGVGSIVGGLSGNSTQKNKVSTLSVKILLRSTDNPSLTIKCFDSRAMTTEHKESIETEGKLESYIYKTGKQHAIEIKDLVSVIIDKVDRADNVISQSDKQQIPNNNSKADEILKLNDLKEKGIITDAEFNEQKIRILNS